MKYVVVRVGQLKEHHTLVSAEKEAERLASTSGEQFYVAELIGKCAIDKKFSWETYKIDNREVPNNKYPESREAWNARFDFPRNHGKQWTNREDAELLKLYIGKNYGTTHIAKLMERTEYAIICRLGALNIL